MKTQEIYNNVLETRDFQHVSQYARRQRNSDLSRPQIAIHSQLRHHCRGCFSRCRASKPLINKEKASNRLRLLAFFFWCSAGISPNGDKLRLPGSSQKKIFPRQKARDIFWCSSGDSNPNRITCFQYLSLSDNTFDNFLLRFTYRLTLLCTCCLRLSSRSV